MHRLIFICLFFVSFHNFAQTIDKEYKQSPLVDILNDFEQFGYKFSYNVADVEDATINLSFRNEPVAQALGQVLKQANLDYQDLGNGLYAIIPRENNAYRLSGRILADNEAMIGAVVRKKGEHIGAVTDINGQFDITGDFNEDDVFTVSYIGYKVREFRAAALQNATIILEPSSLSIKPIVLKEYLTQGIDREETSNGIFIDPERIEAIPGQVEPDIFQTIQLIPGISSPDGSASELNIRGSIPDQNRVFIDDIPIYHSGHFFGNISSINPYLVESIQINKGGAEPSIGSHIAGVVQIQMDDNFEKGSRYGASGNLTHFTAFARQPIDEINSGLTVSLRRSISDELNTITLQRMADKVFQNTNIETQQEDDPDEEQPIFTSENTVSFQEIHAKWKTNFSENTSIQFAFLNTENELNYTENDFEEDISSLDVMNLSSNGFSTLLMSDISPKFSLQLAGGFSEYDYDYNRSVAITDEDIDEEERIFRSNKINEYFANTELIYHWNENISLSAGGSYNTPEVAYVIDEQNEIEGNFSNTDDDRSEDFSGFFNSNIQLGKLNASIGSRFTHYQLIEENRFEPRAHLAYQITDRLQLSSSGGLHSQNVTKVRENGFNELGFSQEVYALSDADDVPLLTASQLDFGIHYADDELIIDAEVFAKRTKGLTTLSTNFNTLPNPEDLLQSGNGQIQGVELLVKKKWNRKLRTWVAYTHSKNEFEDFTELPQSTFNAPNDQRNVFDFVAFYQSDKFSASLGWNYSSGLPFTAVTNVSTFINDDDELDYEYQYSDINGQRTRASHQLNASALYRVLPTKTVSKIEFGVSVFNVYNQRNPLTRSFFLDDSDEENPEIFSTERNRQLFTPNALVRVEF